MNRKLKTKVLVWVAIILVKFKINHYNICTCCGYCVGRRESLYTKLDIERA